VSALRVRGIVKRFGAHPANVALAGVDFDVGERERVVVLGPTGAGKTTLLRTIAGLETPDAGTLELGGVDATTLAPSARDVALVFQNFSLYPHWSVRGNLEFPLRAPGRALAPAEVRERVQWAAALLRIEKLLDRPAKHLSGGEMQRVALGRALVRRPKLFLMDEPLTNLDAKLREALRVELLRLFQELQVPVVWVTHDQAEALSMGERVVVLAAGRVLQVGTPREVYLSPASPAVARQLGQPPINLLAVERRGDHWCAGDGARLVGDPDEACAVAGSPTSTRAASATRRAPASASGPSTSRRTAAGRKPRSPSSRTPARIVCSCCISPAARSTSSCRATSRRRRGPSSRRASTRAMRCSGRKNFRPRARRDPGYRPLARSPTLPL